MEELFAQIESHRTAARVNVASGQVSFLQAADALEPVQKLGDLARVSVTNRAAIISRVGRLVAMRVDPRYQNPHDSALAIYLRVLHPVDKELAWIAASAVLDARNCWWASDMARRIISRADEKSDATTVSAVATELITAEQEAMGESLITHFYPSVLVDFKPVIWSLRTKGSDTAQPLPCLSEWTSHADTAAPEPRELQVV